jgi:4-amino-4-deoxy-L-arabinose transferase-like glycosyltransferase
LTRLPDRSTIPRQPTIPSSPQDRPLRTRHGRETAVLVGLLAIVFATRAWHADQPILEGYVGRQVPTAMVASNLARGAVFLRPQLDTGPFPNLFLVEPPIAAWLAASLSSITGLPLDVAGRLISAAASALAAWGLFELVRHRSGPRTACAAVVAFASFPVTIRYGRAFQPDALAMGLVVAGLHFWDRPGRWAATAGWALLSLGLAQKVTYGAVLLPLTLVVGRGRPARDKLAMASTLLPAVLWYIHAWGLLSDPGPGSAASADNAANWLSRLSTVSLLDRHRPLIVARDLLVRSFTPVGLLLGVGGILRVAGVSSSLYRSVLIPPGIRRRDSSDPDAASRALWCAWTTGSGLVLLLLYGKLHHDYYWLLLAPPMAAWVGLGVDAIAHRSRWAATSLLVALISLGALQSRSTWRIPAEWWGAPELARSVARNVPPDALVIAPEAVIHLGGRRGCRLEWEPGSVRRAANEWRPSPPFAEDDPVALVAFYRSRAGARYFADFEPSPCDPARRSLHEAIRRDPTARLLDDRPGLFLLAEFAEPDRPIPARRAP